MFDNLRHKNMTRVHQGYQDRRRSALSNYDDVQCHGPIRGQYSGHVICLDQSEASMTDFILSNFMSSRGGGGKLLRWQEFSVKRRRILESSRRLLTPETEQFQEIGEGVRKKRNSYLDWVLIDSTGIWQDDFLAGELCLHQGGLWHKVINNWYFWLNQELKKW